MTEAEAGNLVDEVMLGRTLEVQWEDRLAYCSYVVRYEAGTGFISRYDEIPHDVCNPWPDTVTRTWSGEELVTFLKSVRLEDVKA